MGICISILDDLVTYTADIDDDLLYDYDYRYYMHEYHFDIMNRMASFESREILNY